MITNNYAGFRPFSNNVVFVDTEFSSNDPNTGEILSVGMATLDQKELYLEIDTNCEVSPWVKKNIIPTLTQFKLTKDDVKKRISEFVGNKKPYMITFVDSYDFVYLCKLFGYEKIPFNNIPIDFAGIMFALGFDPHTYRDTIFNQQFSRDLGIDTTRYMIHNALDDAKKLRDVYLKLLEYNF